MSDFLVINNRSALTQVSLANTFNVTPQAVSNQSKRQKLVQGVDWDYYNENTKQIVKSYKGLGNKIYYHSGIAKLNFSSNSDTSKDFKNKAAKVLAKQANQKQNQLAVESRIANLEQEFLKQKPLVEFANLYLSNTDNSLSFTEFSALISKDGLYFSSKTLLDFLINKSILSKIKGKKTQRHIPKTKYIKDGWFELTRKDIDKTTVLITPKGQFNILNIIKDQKTMIEVKNNSGKTIKLPAREKATQKINNTFSLDKEENNKLKKIIFSHWITAEMFDLNNSLVEIDKNIKTKLIERFERQKNSLLLRHPKDLPDIEFLLEKTKKVNATSSLIVKLD